VNHEAALRAAIPEDVATLMGRLHSHSFAAYVVGGAVRDVLSSVPPSQMRSMRIASVRLGSLLELPFVR
jgi:hypothetical protein